MSVSSLERRCQEVFERYAVVRSETERVRKRFEALRRSSSALQADVDRLLVEARAEHGRSAAVRHTASQLIAKCADNLDAISWVVSTQRELEEDIRRREVNRTIERVIEVFAARGMFAFRWDAMSDLPHLSRNTHRAVARVQ